jgi:hypothetical protein
MGLGRGYRDQRGAELSPAPWRLCPTWNRPGVRLEVISGDASVAQELISGHPCGGTETGSNRADARRKPATVIHGLELTPHVVAV